MSLHRHSLRLSPVRPSSSRFIVPALRVGGRGANGAACLPRDVMPTAGGGRGHALDVERFRLSICHASVIPSALLLGCDEMATGTGTAPMRYGYGGCFPHDVMATKWRRNAVRVPWMGLRLVRDAMLA